MAFHDDLLGQAFHLTDRDPETQADLRRAISSAYYALFHLLISETIANWGLDSSRGNLARMFEHSLMKRVSKRIIDPKQCPFRREDQIVVGNLRDVAKRFIQLQDNRHIADYDGTVVWTKTDALDEVRKAELAFRAWLSIRHSKIAQDYLVSLLIKPRD